ncbi:MAG TPA: tRNA uridine-5-carboxymethylaminomethyl(34) synthesis GTPase MnmE [Chitinophagaceae bacterium]|nr:tRNA uridine-5-carboxymethylaminomethyl(34) synthesis GTPase MnmE [Chitinophagaceae bacterium]
MNGKLSGWDDTIVALATAPGVAAIGVIRLSGEKAIQIANALFPSKDLLKENSHTLHVGLLKDEDHLLDEVVVSLFKNPKSYTGEDIVEIGAHGSSFIHQQIIDACIKRGARLARPGEFTQRAFLKGKLDLIQAEAVADLIASNTAASHHTALKNIRGGFSDKLKELRVQMITFSALIELELDFSQEDVEFADRTKFYDLINQLTQLTDKLINSFQLGNVIKNGVSVAIVGKPNAGKSTLLNSLLNENRAIVSEIAGTTRDTIEEVINIDGILFRLIDTAGIREHSTDSIEKIGIERSLEKIKTADIVLYMFDSGSESIEDLKTLVASFKKEGIKFLMVANKIDREVEAEVKEKYFSVENVVFISAKENRHTEILKGRMVDLVLAGKLNTENIVVTNARHFHALKEVQKSLNDIYEGLENKLPGDLLALDIRRCLHYLGEITGEITNEDQLDYIFSKFCIGK